MTDHAQQGAATGNGVRIPVLGVAATFVSEAPEVGDALRSQWGYWAELPPGVVTDSPNTVRVTVERAIGRGSDSPAPVYHVPDPTRFAVVARGAFGLADTRRSESLVWVDPTWASRPAALVGEVLEPLTLFLAGARDRIPLHASAVVRDGVAVVLAGPSGAGKSTLAYAARRAGFATLADEPVYVQSTPTTRVWGRHGRLHLAVEAREHFPELRRHEPVALPSGKTKIVVGELGPAPRYAERAGVCLLQREEVTRPNVVRLSVPEVVTELTRRLDPGFDLFSDSIAERIEQVADRGAWLLRWSGGPHQAVPLLEQVAEALGAE